ncbi:LysR family transcriptional regulator [Loigolactobacillus binensis]|uniref:LysR family transcriptional regulator n=1 Tax=Loigolactobacillus binensis TaxID=2559922 RepID=A0ABW3EEN6_9LACO|nr:LysR family transcriptional regulator [Loigolactobacillus binensis]
MDFARLAEFIAIIDAGSIAQAATKLNLSAATLSHRLRQFEQTLGFKLFKRNHTRMELTAEGYYFYQDALRISQHYRAIKQAMHQATE